jgi:peptidoglycan hydrolase-like protein with peptidoglycan-binding domain
MVSTPRAALTGRINNGRDPTCVEQPRPAQPTAVDDDVLPYAIKKGDTLTAIAKAHDTTVDELIELNPQLKTNPGQLRIGQQIDVPGADKIERPAKRIVDEATKRSSRERAMAGEVAVRARIEGQYAIPAPSFQDIAAGARMKRGMGGESVKDLQRKLNALGAEPPLDVDGKLGPKTEAALKEFQADHAVQQTGVLGPTTLEVLLAAKPRPLAARTRANRTIDVDDLQGGSKAHNLARIAERTARRMNSVGMCALGVNDSLIAAGLAAERGHAYQKAEQLTRDPDFNEVNVAREQLTSLPPGAVVVWGRSRAKPYGHVTVTLGNGMEASDHVQRMITGGRYGTDFGNGPDRHGRQFRVFLPA